MTSVPGRGRGGDAGQALNRLKPKGRLSKAAPQSVVSAMSSPSRDEQAASRPTNPEAELVEAPAPVASRSPEPQQAPQTAAEPLPAAQQEAPADPAPAPQPAQAKEKAKPRRKMSLTPADEDEHDRIRQTFMATRHIHRLASLNDFLRACVLKEIARLEDDHNDGQAYEYEGVEIPKGRPLKF